MRTRLRILWSLLHLPPDVIHTLELYQRVWDVPAVGVVTYLVRHRKLRQWMGEPPRAEDITLEA